MSPVNGTLNWFEGKLVRGRIGTRADWYGAEADWYKMGVQRIRTGCDWQSGTEAGAEWYAVVQVPGGRKSQ